MILQTHKVVVDDYKGAFDATSHLIEQGYKRIAHLTISKQLTITQNRLNGYLDALKAHKIPVRKEWIVYCDFDEGNMKNEVKKTGGEQEKAQCHFFFSGEIVYDKRKGFERNEFEGARRCGTGRLC